MVKPIETQSITNRSVEYAKDVSALLRRDELSNEFASRLNRSETEQEMRSVTEMEEARGTRVNADDQHGANQDESGSNRHDKRHTVKSADEDEFRPGLPSVGVSERRVLDIEV